MPTADGGLSGRIDATLAADNRAFDDQGRLEGRGDLLFNDERRQLRTGLSLALRRRDSHNEAGLYQLYIEKRFLKPQLALSLGRMQRADALGVYSLDGSSVRVRRKSLSLEFYGGKPGRIEGYRSVEADSLYGMEVQWQRQNDTPWWRHRLHARLGWQRLSDGGHVDRLNGGLRASGPAAVGPFTDLDLLLQGTYLPAEAAVTDLQAQAKVGVGKRGLARFALETYDPDETDLSFRQRFYSLYASGRQTTALGEFHYRQKTARTWHLRGRRVTREYGVTGYGLSVGVDGRGPRGQRWNAQLDRLTLAGDESISLYVDTAAALSVNRRVTLSGALQAQRKARLGDNRVLGIEARVEQKLRADLYAACFAVLIRNSRLDDEYRAGVRLSYFFDDRLREVKP